MVIYGEACGTKSPAAVDGGCAGPFGFMQLVDAMSDPEHPDHEALMDWYGEPFHADDIELYKVEAMLGRIRAQRRKGPRKRRQA